MQTDAVPFCRLFNALGGWNRISRSKHSLTGAADPDSGLQEEVLMRSRSMRPNIYLPVVRFGVVVADWKYILCATLVGYLVPFFFRLKIGNVPLWFVTGIGAAALSYGFFRYTKVGRRTHWFQHSTRATFDGAVARRSLPSDRSSFPGKAWVSERQD